LSESDMCFITASLSR